MIDLSTGATRKVSHTKTEDGRVFGWLLESAVSGAFAAARRIFFDACKLIDWALDRAARSSSD
jgi:hypothetical protein